MALCLLTAGAVIAAQPAQATPGSHAAAATCSPVLKSVKLSPASVPGGASSTVTATLSCPAPTAETVTLKGFTGARVPATLHVAVGKSSASGVITTATRTTAVHGWITGTLGRSSQRALLTVGVTPKTCTTPALAAISLPSLAYVGDHPVLAVTLSCTPATAVKVTLTSGATPASAPPVPVPATVTIGAYYHTASVPLAPKAYQPGQYGSTVSVTYRAKTLTAAITVDPGLSVFQNAQDTCSPNDVNLNVLFTGDVPAGGLTVALKSSNAAVTVPATYSFTQQGSIGGGVTGVTVQPVSVNTKVTLSVTLGSRTLTASANQVPAWTSGDKITLVPSSGPGPFYGPSTGYAYEVILSAPAPVGSVLSGTVTTDHPNDVQLDGNQVSIVGGCDNGAFSFSVPFESGPVHATVTVSLGGSTVTAKPVIEPSIASVTLPATITGGQTGTGTVTLAGAPDAPDTVFLQTQNGIATTPGSVTVPAGQASVTFPITTIVVTSDAQASVEAWHAVGDQVADSAFSNTMDVTP